MSSNYIFFYIIFAVLLVSTDPAHSLSDAFRSQFGSEPISPNTAALPNLDVMEVDPQATVQVILCSLNNKERTLNNFKIDQLVINIKLKHSIFPQAELGSWAALAKEFPGASDITDKIKSFQDWLSG